MPGQLSIVTAKVSSWSNGWFSAYGRRGKIAVDYGGKPSTEFCYLVVQNHCLHCFFFLVFFIFVFQLFLIWSLPVANVCTCAGWYRKGLGKRDGQDAVDHGGRAGFQLCCWVSNWFPLHSGIVFFCCLLCFFFFQLLLIWSLPVANVCTCAGWYRKGLGKRAGQDAVDHGGRAGFQLCCWVSNWFPLHSGIVFFCCLLCFFFFQLLLIWNLPVANVCTCAGWYRKGLGKRDGQDAVDDGGRVSIQFCCWVLNRFPFA